MINWLIVYWFIDLLIYWFIDLLIYWFIDLLIYWFVDLSICRFVDLLGGLGGLLWLCIVLVYVWLID